MKRALQKQIRIEAALKELDYNGDVVKVTEEES